MSHSSPPKNRRRALSSTLFYLLIPALLIALVVGAAIVLVGGEEEKEESAKSPFISPEAYVAEYMNGGSDHLLVDVRTVEEFESGHIPDAVNIPLQELDQRLSEIPTDQTVILYCRSGNRSAQAYDLLSNAGYSDMYDLGGIIDWTAKGLPVE